MNLGEITKALDSLRLTKRNEPLNENETYASYAHAIVSVIFTEDRVSQYIVNSRLYFLLSFWDKLAEYQIDPRVAKRTTDHLLDALYNDHNSYFYRQRSENGVSLAVNIYEVIFTNPYLLAKRGLLNPPSTLFRKYEQLDSEYLSVFLKALSDSISTYWQEMCNPEIKQEIVRALEKLGKYSETLARATQDPTNGKEPFEQLSLISSFLQYEYLQLYVIAKRDKLMISEEEISVSTDASSGKSINYAYVEAIYAFLAALSYAKEEGDFLIKTAARNVVDGLFTPVVSETHIKILKERCIQLIWEKIMGEGEQNVRSMTPNIKGYFPVVARTYLDAVLSKHRPSSNTIIEERKKLTAFLYESLKPKLKEKMQDDVSLFEDQFLPKSIVFNETTNKFEHKLWGGKTEEI